MANPMVLRLISCGSHRHRNDGSLGHVLDGDTQRYGNGTGKRNVRCAVIGSCKHHAHSHSFGQIVDGDGEGKHRGLR